MSGFANGPTTTADVIPKASASPGIHLETLSNSGKAILKVPAAHESRRNVDEAFNLDNYKPNKDAVANKKSKPMRSGCSTSWLHSCLSCICSKEVERRTFWVLFITCVLSLIYFGVNLQSGFDALTVQRDTLNVQVQGELLL
jgi:hypothetical protein